MKIIAMATCGGILIISKYMEGLEVPGNYVDSWQCEGVTKLCEGVTTLCEGVTMLCDGVTKELNISDSNK